MKIFNIENFEPVPSDEFYLIEEFKNLMSAKYNMTEEDKSGRYKKRGMAEARFMYFACDHRSEFAKYSEDNKIAESLTAAGLPENYKISDKLEAAIERYNKLQQSRTLRLLQAANKSIDKLTGFFEQVDFTTRDQNGNLLYEPKDVISNISNLGKVLEGLEKLEEAVRKQEGQESTTRGEAEKGRL